MNAPYADKSASGYIGRRKDNRSAEGNWRACECRNEDGSFEGLLSFWTDGKGRITL
jgi:hypothetical protein